MVSRKTSRARKISTFTFATAMIIGVALLLAYWFGTLSGVAGAGAAKRTAAERDGFATGEAVTCLSHSCNEFFSIAIAKGA